MCRRSLLGVPRFTGASWCTDIRRPPYISVHWHKCIAIHWPEKQCKSPRKKPWNLYWLATDVDKFCGQCNIMETCHSCFPSMIFHMILLYLQHLWCGKHNYLHHQFKLLLWPARMWPIAPCGRPYHPLLSWWLIKLFTCCWTLSSMQRWSIFILKLNSTIFFFFFFLGGGGGGGGNVCKKHVL